MDIAALCSDITRYLLYSITFYDCRNFEIKHLAQLKTILPEGYKLTEAPCLFEGVKTRSILIDMPILKDESEGNFAPENEKRRKLFVERLYDRIKSHHKVDHNAFIIAIIFSTDSIQAAPRYILTNIFPLRTLHS